MMKDMKPAPEEAEKEQGVTPEPNPDTPAVTTHPLDEVLPEEEIADLAEMKGIVAADPPAEFDNGQLPAGAPAPDEDLDTRPLDANRTLPLPPIESTTMPIIARSLDRSINNDTSLTCVCRSHVGTVRNRNQDSCFAFTSYNGGHETIPPFGLFIVADGMGGHMDGDVAGRIVSRTVATHIMKSIYLPLLAGRPQADQRPIAEIMEDAAARANAALRTAEANQPMGTTLTAGLLFGRRLYVIHAGDSRAYLHANDTLKLLTTDHSVVKALEEAGQITAEEAAIHPNRNLLYRALMGDELEVDSFSTLLPREGRLILCSDGLWGLISDEVLTEILGSSRSPAQVADALLQMALDAGGNDNISLILADFTL